MTRLEWVRYCISGIQNCFPEVYYGDKLGKNYPHKLLWNQKNSTDFAVEVMNWTVTDNLEDSLVKLQKWESQLKQGLPLDRTIPPDETINVDENLDKQKSVNEYDRVKNTKDALLRSQKYREKIEKEIQSQQKIETNNEEKIGIKIIRDEKGNKVNSDFSTLGDRIRFSWAGPSPTLPLRALRIDPKDLEEKALSLDEKNKQEVIKIATELRKVNQAFYRHNAELTYEKVALLTSADSGFNQSEVFLLMRPQGQGGTIAVPNQSALGGVFSNIGKQLFGKVVNKGIEKAIGAAAGKAATTAATTVAGTAIAPGVGTAIGLAANKIGDWLKEHKELALGLGLSTLGMGLIAIGAPLIVGFVPLAFGGLSLLGTAAGGLGAIGQGVGGFGNALLAGFTAVVLPAIGVPLLIGSIGFPVLVAIILFIINTGAYMVPPQPISESAFQGQNIVCTKEKGPVSFSNSTSSPISQRAWKITADLYQGFWCYWNRSPGDYPEDITLYPPSYPELFNEILFAQNPNPTREQIQGCGNCLFWCTYLIQKSYRETGNNLQNTLWAPTMQDDFQRRGKFISAGNATPQNILPGSVIFFKVSSGPNRTNHVGIVHSVNQDSIMYIQSNAPTKDGSLVFNLSGRGIQNLSGLGIVGIGLP